MVFPGIALISVVSTDMGLSDPSRKRKARKRGKEMTRPEYIGFILKRLRIAEGWTQQALAQFIGVSAHRLGMWERGTSWPSEIEVRKCLAVFGLTPSDIPHHWRSLPNGLS